MRIAWIGPMPNETGGATEVATQLLAGLAQYDVDIDCFFPGHRSAVPARLARLPHLHFHCESSSWAWGRWYSRNRLLCFITGQAANYRSENRLAKRLIDLHRRNPYDVLYQFSHIELSILRKFVDELPPIVLHPSVHAAGELKWLKREAVISRKTEPLLRRVGTRLMLQVRAAIQKRHIVYPTHIVSMSENFANELVVDYRVPRSKLSIVPNPVDTIRFTPAAPTSGDDAQGRLKFLFVSRIAVRKGVEMMVELSHRLQDVADSVQIEIIGDRSLWSDYTPLLRQLNPHVAVYVGKVQADGMNDRYRSAQALIQPSHYEPFGLTVGESLACGIPVVASDKVGATEGVHPDCCRVFPAGDMDALEREVRRLIDDLTDKASRERMAHLARSEAERLFSCPVVTWDLIRCLAEVTGHSVWRQEHVDERDRETGS